MILIDISYIARKIGQFNNQLLQSNESETVQCLDRNKIKFLTINNNNKCVRVAIRPTLVTEFIDS